MNPIHGTNQLLRLDKNGKLKNLMVHDRAPHIAQPTEKELDALIAYWKVISNHIEAIHAIQKYDPDYMPPFEMVELVDGDLKITAMVN